MIKFKNLIENLKTDKKMIVMLILGAVGIVLILLSEFTSAKPKEKTAENENNSFYEYESEIETRLSSIITQINGVGRVNVMVTLKSGEENNYAYNETYQNKNGEQSNDRKEESEYVVIDGERGDECVLLRTDFPQVQGVVVVCDGGDNNTVKNDVTNAVSALLDINTNNISVLKMKNSEE